MQPSVLVFLACRVRLLSACKSCVAIRPSAQGGTLQLGQQGPRSRIRRQTPKDPHLIGLKGPSVCSPRGPCGSCATPVASPQWRLVHRVRQSAPGQTAFRTHPAELQVLEVPGHDGTHDQRRALAHLSCLAPHQPPESDTAPGDLIICDAAHSADRRPDQRASALGITVAIRAFSNTAGDLLIYLWKGSSGGSKAG